MSDPQYQPNLFPEDSGAPQVPPNQHVHLLALSRIRGVGEASVKALMQKYNDLSAVWSLPQQELAAVLSRAGLRAAEDVAKRIVEHNPEFWIEVEREAQRLARQDIRLVMWGDADYPTQLRSIKNPPLWLFVQGNSQVLSSPRLVAVVGTREATPQGITLARMLSVWLAQHRFGIVSGLAEGIDAVAHQTALDYGVPTIAVLGTGISVVFPAGTSALRQSIIERGGVLVTEYFPNTSYSRVNFVRRNRIQAGLSAAVAPIEGRADSGTAHTLNFARQFHRLAFGVTVESQPNRSELITVLTRANNPIFDLESDDSMRQLAAFLGADEMGEAASSSPPGFASVKQEFERIIKSYPVTRGDVQQLLNEMQAIWRQRRRHVGHGSDSRS